MKKRLTVLLLCGLICCWLASCNQTNSENSSENGSDPPAAPIETQPAFTVAEDTVMSSSFCGAVNYCQRALAPAISDYHDMSFNQDLISENGEYYIHTDDDGTVSGFFKGWAPEEVFDYNDSDLFSSSITLDDGFTAVLHQTTVQEFLDHGYTIERTFEKEASAEKDGKVLTLILEDNIKNMEDYTKETVESIILGYDSAKMNAGYPSMLNQKVIDFHYCGIDTASSFEDVISVFGMPGSFIKVDTNTFSGYIDNVKTVIPNTYVTLYYDTDWAGNEKRSMSVYFRYHVELDSMELLGVVIRQQTK